MSPQNESQAAFRQSSRWPTAGIAIVTTLLTLAAALIGLHLQEYRIAAFWPAGGVITGLALIARRGEQRLAVILGAVLALAIANILQQRGLYASAIFMAGYIGEAMLVTYALERRNTIVRLDTLRRVGAFFGVSTVVVVLVGALSAAGLKASGYVHEDYRHIWLLWLTAHAVGLFTVTPAIVTIRARWSEQRMRAFLDAPGWIRLSAFALLAYVLVGEVPHDNESWLIASLAAIYAMLLWISAKSAPVWAALALLVLGAVVVWHTGHGDGLFFGRADAARIFLLVAAFWTLTLSALLEQQQVSRQAVRESEIRMREALRVGRAFAFDWEPSSNVVVRSDDHQVMGSVQIESAETFFERVHPDDRAEFTARLKRLRPESPSYEAIYRYHRPDGRLIWLEERASASFDQQGRITRLRGLTADVTERKAAEEALREADRMKDRFIATLSHELRNPLAPIRNAVAMLRKTGTDDPRADWCHQVIERQAAHMAYLLDELLDVSRISLGKLKLMQERVELRDIVERAAETVTSLYAADGHTLSISLPEQPVWLHADPVRLTQALSNLLSNAAKYAQPGSTTELTAVVDSAPGEGGQREVRLSVRDNGVGIDPDQLERVFDMFVQVDSTLDRSQGGLGIGLWLVRQIVNLHGGRIEARSEGVGKGSVFVLTLPVVDYTVG